MNDTPTEKLKAFPPILGTRQEGSLLPLLFNIVLEALAREVRQEKEMYTSMKVVNCHYFHQYMILFIENPNDTPKKLLQ